MNAIDTPALENTGSEAAQTVQPGEENDNFPEQTDAPVPLLQQKVPLEGIQKMKTKREPGFATGFDLFTTEEQAKREARAARFGVSVAEQPNEALEAARKKAERREKFGIEEAEVSAMDVDLRDERRVPGPDAQIRNDAVHLYGTDEMSTKDVLVYFRDYGPSRVEWLDDSSCNIMFEDEYSAGRAVQGLSIPIDTNEANPWRFAIDFEKARVGHVRLQMRLATSTDVKPSFAERKPSRWDRRRPRRHQKKDQSGDVVMEGISKRGRRSKGKAKLLANKLLSTQMEHIQKQADVL